MKTKIISLLDAIKALLDGGVIVDNYSPIEGESEYKVMQAVFENQPEKCIGHITEKQFSRLRSKGIILYRGMRRLDETGDLLGYFSLAKEGEK